MLNNVLFAHRGIYNNIDIPENSLLSFKKAIDLDYPIEMDVNITKDNVLIVFHDDNLKRMANLDRNINDLNYSEIEELFLLQTREKIPTLEEVLRLVKGKVLLNIEIKKSKKSHLLINKLIKLLDSYDGEYIVQSFYYKNLYYLERKKPNIIKGLLISKKKDNYINLMLYTKICKINFISISKNIVNMKKYRKYIDKYPIFIWTIRSKDELEKYMDKFSGYICDNL